MTKETKIKTNNIIPIKIPINLNNFNNGFDTYFSNLSLSNYLFVLTNSLFIRE